MFGTSFDVATAMHAVGIMENAVLSILRRKETEQAGHIEFSYKRYKREERVSCHYNQIVLILGFPSTMFLCF